MLLYSYLWQLLFVDSDYYGIYGDSIGITMGYGENPQYEYIMAVWYGMKWFMVVYEAL